MRSLPNATNPFKRENVLARRKEMEKLASQISLEVRAENYCNYRGKYVPNRRQVELCGAKSAGIGSQNMRETGGAVADRDVVDYLKRTRKPTRLLVG